MLLVEGRRTVRAKEVFPVQVFGRDVRGSLQSVSCICLRSPTVLLQIQPARQMDTKQKQTGHL